MQNWNGTLESERVMLLGRKSGRVFDGSSCGGKDLTVAHHQASTAGANFSLRGVTGKGRWKAEVGWLHGASTARGKTTLVARLFHGFWAFLEKNSRLVEWPLWIEPAPPEGSRSLQFVTHWSDSPGCILDPKIATGADDFPLPALNLVAQAHARTSTYDLFMRGHSVRNLGISVLFNGFSDGHFGHWTLGIAGTW